ncbi:TATA box-binding protein-associated factor RNA polymerase I subunit D [Meleagris gallopavo]|uniref:TATA box-binding protein-associated factor RNA polymerase I subunit D n=1 Tax=Meleagris gallopavo TaxID=9103 RepID=G1NQN5_MELGA|nr:TATA box-binding protein-associated factor RNA polymerase I subunit D [Meleagris gallopavo]XP_019467837.1 TATA box-binding protein-associated factor RNA polymerase I subunit D [Meleagris gallopavo]XP_019467839.1 TATA box-binding protein-associated factor RNA polymerase I subunit D [Meleagris gallopavo]XP_019467840.1 TATA box-binding protein-associated factor RNA polymerase I subunit D [Meleagris gallopavo]XP_019467842.1 TATA box-binding protein-associated factor RNA polymerase I subunit D [M
MTDTDESHTSSSDYPDAQDLISPQRKKRSKIPECAASAQKEHLCSRQKGASPEESSDEISSTDTSSDEVDSSDSEIDVSAASGSKHHRKHSAVPSKQKKKSQPSRQQPEADAGVPGSESSDSSLPTQSPARPPEASQEKKSKLNLKAIFAYHFRGRKFKAAAHRKYRSSGSQKKKGASGCSQRRSGKQPMTASPQERRKRLKDRGFQFPFVEKHYGRKHIPLKMVLSYEQAAAKGYFQYVEMLKYEEHLKKALKALEASDDLERECLAVRKHKYLDDEGPLSPIQETNDDDNNCLGTDNPEDLDVRVVDNSCFIISSKIPNKKKSKAETKRAKSAGVVEVKKSAADN